MPQPRAFAFLYQIAIVGNRITAMGMSGIGMPRLISGLADKRDSLTGLQWARVLLGNPVIGLEIRLNLIFGCLLNPFDQALQSEAMLHGLGGVSLGLCEDVSIVENRIEANGTISVEPSGRRFTAQIIAHDSPFTFEHFTNATSLARNALASVSKFSRYEGCAIGILRWNGIAGLKVAPRPATTRRSRAGSTEISLTQSPTGHRSNHQSAIRRGPELELMRDQTTASAAARL